MRSMPEVVIGIDATADNDSGTAPQGLSLGQPPLE